MTRRLPAEWETQQAIQFTFPHQNSDWAEDWEEVLPCFITLVETVSQYQRTIVVCEDTTLVANYLKGANSANLKLVAMSSNDTWARDHGAISVWEGEELVLLDFMFNGWGLKFPADKDNLITQQLYQKGILRANRCEKPSLVLEGGSIESDGQGTLLTTAQCLLSPNRNPHFSQIEIEQALRQYLGIHRFLWLHHGYLEGDDTDAHIDTLARFCTPEVIAYVQCTDINDEHYTALQQMETELKAFKTAKGQPYHLVPLPMPTAIYDKNGQRLPATYANFLIMNKVVLMPTYQVIEDEKALAILQAVFSNRKVIGIDCRPLILQHGSLHCVTMQYV